MVLAGRPNPTDEFVVGRAEAGADPDGPHGTLMPKPDAATAAPAALGFGGIRGAYLPRLSSLSPIHATEDWSETLRV